MYLLHTLFCICSCAFACSYSHTNVYAFRTLCARACLCVNIRTYRRSQSVGGHAAGVVMAERAHRKLRTRFFFRKYMDIFNLLLYCSMFKSISKWISSMDKSQSLTINCGYVLQSFRDRFSQNGYDRPTYSLLVIIGYREWSWYKVFLVITIKLKFSGFSH